MFNKIEGKITNNKIEQGVNKLKNTSAEELAKEFSKIDREELKRKINEIDKNKIKEMNIDINKKNYKFRKPNAENIINILLIGQDRRPGEGRSRSDAMILCTINKKNDLKK